MADAPKSPEQIAEVLTGEPLTLGYRPSLPASALMHGHTLHMVYRDLEWMLMHPLVCLARTYYCSPLSAAEFEVRASSSEVGEFGLAELQRFWEECLDQAQLVYDYGWNGYETVYEERNGHLRLSGLIDFHPRDTSVLTRDYRYAGVRVRKVESAEGGEVDLWGQDAGRPPKALWLTHRPRYHRWYGRPQGLGAHRPWRRMATRDGVEMIIDGGYYRFAYAGPVLYHPPKSVWATVVGTDPKDLAKVCREFVENAKAGVSLALPAIYDKDGNKLFELVWPEHSFQGGSLLEYKQDVKRDLFAGYEVPLELVEAAETGSGYSGRAIPMEGFYASQQRNARNFVRAWKEQIGDPLIAFNFGDGWFEVTVKPLLESKEKAAQGRSQATGEGQQQQQPPAQLPPPANPDQPSQPPAQLSLPGPDPWEAYQGPRGGRGWKNRSTGRILYGSAKPSERQRREVKDASAAPKPSDLAERIQAHVTGGTLPAEHVAGEVAQLARHLRIWEVEDLAHSLQLPVGPKDSKTAMLARIEDALRAKAAKPSAAAKRVAVVPTKSLHVDPERFQYKLDVRGPRGVGEELQGVRAFNPDLAGVIMAWNDPEDGLDYVVNGHHRHELADRLEYPELLVRYIDAKDAKEARAKGALANIAEGRGTAIDAAKFMRDMQVSTEDMAKVGISLKGSVARDAQALVRLDDGLFSMLTRGQIAAPVALAIGTELEDHTQQRALLDYVHKQEAKGKRVAADVVQEMAREIKDTPKTTETVASLFGDIQEEKSLFLERNQLKAFVRDALVREANVFKAVSTEGKAETLRRGGNVIEAERNRAIAQESEQAKNYFDQLVNRKGELSDALNQATERFAQARNQRERQKVQAEVLEALRSLIGKGLAA